LRRRMARWSRSRRLAARVHVWVFALQTCQDPRAYRRLSIDQWEFRVMPHRQLLATRQQSARLASSTGSASPRALLEGRKRHPDCPRCERTGLRSRPDATTRCSFARDALAAHINARRSASRVQHRLKRAPGAPQLRPSQPPSRPDSAGPGRIMRTTALPVAD
jgi:hypothetical protein